MIDAIIAFLYITGICWSYGDILIFLLEKCTGKKLTESPSPLVSCFTGLAFIGIIYSFVVLLIPLGGIIIQIALILPSITWIIIHKKRVLLSAASPLSKIKNYPFLFKTLLFSCVLLLLIMSVSIINHPDTLVYHAQNIKWIEEFGTTIGYINLKYHYGIQSSWFTLCALFRFSFFNSPALTFINISAAIWLVLFICQKIYLSFNNGKQSVFSWLLLLIITFWSYTQLRMMVTSGSPDFIATIYIWLVFYLFLSYQNSDNPALFILLIFLGFFSVTIKLSAVPIILFCLYAYYRYAAKNNWIHFLLPLLTGLFIFIPYLVKNVITTGYIFFPITNPDIFNVDWKAPKHPLDLINVYIRAYAQTNVSRDNAEIMNVAKMDVIEWLPIWWKLRSIADKTVFLSILLLSCANLFFIKKNLVRENERILTAFLFSITGIIFWFLKAPDPRFGFGFLIAAIGIMAYLFEKNVKIKLSHTQLFLKLSILIFSLVMFSYSFYRLRYYFKPINILHPSGIGIGQFRTIKCDNISINIPINQECGDIAPPCTRDSCGRFAPRGSTIKDGFRPREIH